MNPFSSLILIILIFKIVSSISHNLSLQCSLQIIRFIQLFYLMRSSLELQTRTKIQPGHLKKLIDIYDSIQTSPQSTPFINPVNWKQTGLTNYPLIIDHPMDLNTINKKLILSEYQTVEDFLDDFQLIWDNCKKYNQETSDIYNLAKVLEKKFSDKLHQYFPKLLKRYETMLIPQQERPILIAQQKQPIQQRTKLLFVQRVKKLRQEQLARLVKFIMRVSPFSCRQSEIKYRFQIMIDSIGVNQWQQIEKQLINLEDVDDQVTKKVKF